MTESRPVAYIRTSHITTEPETALILEQRVNIPILNSEYAWSHREWTSCWTRQTWPEQPHRTRNLVFVTSGCTARIWVVHLYIEPFSACEVGYVSDLATRYTEQTREEECEKGTRHRKHQRREARPVGLTQVFDLEALLARGLD